MENCSVLFKIRANTSLGQHIRIIGDHPQLGSWNPEQGLVLYTNSEIYPFWISNEIISMAKDQKIHFKCAVMQGEDPVQWEDRLIENRTYRAANKRVVLKGFFNDPDLIELIEQSFEALVKPPTSVGKLQGP